MKLTADAKRRVVLPPPIEEGDLLLLDSHGHNRWLLTRIAGPKQKNAKKTKRKSVAEALAASTGANAIIAEFKREYVRRVKL